MTEFRLTQTPAPGASRLSFRGDTIEFFLDLPEKISGNAWIRTNIGNVATSRWEIIQAVTADEPVLGRAWYDIPMTPVTPARFAVTLALCDVGHFEAKCFFINSNGKTPIWPQGPNVIVNVEPADLCCANIIYNAFVRQFGPNKSGAFQISRENAKDIEKLDHDGYTVIPPSGTFRDLISELDFIIYTLGCRALHLLPINPTPTTYGRMGRFGSPYAALDFKGIDPALAVFDPKATPLEQFIELVDAVHARNAKIIIDLAPNHTGWAAELHETHPEWLVRDAEGAIQAPGAWGVVWEDLTRLDYTNKELWKYMADVFLTWCQRGVDGFRCDAGYMIPVPAWRFIVAKVREQFPDTVFFLEGLGGKISVTREILSSCNFNWAYSELFQSYDRSQIETCLDLCNDINFQNGLMIHFAETHDNNRLAAVSPAYAAMRTALCALVSHCGGFGFANGMEWYATEKINVHDASSLNWGSAANQVDKIQRLTLILKFHPAFSHCTDLKLVHQDSGDYIALLRHHLPSDQRVLVLVNLDMAHPVPARWPAAEFAPENFSCIDMLSAEFIPITRDGNFTGCLLDPGRVLCLSPEPDALGRILEKSDPMRLPDRIHHQRLRSMVLEILRFFTGSIHVADLDIHEAVLQLETDPETFCRTLRPGSDEPRMVVWQWPEDSRRLVMVPPGHLLMVRSDIPFTARIIARKNGTDQTLGLHQSIVSRDNTHFTIMTVKNLRKTPLHATLKLSIYQNKTSVHRESPLLYLCSPKHGYAKTVFGRKDVLYHSLRTLGTNGRGAMMRANARWGEIESRYDALLAANLNPNCPDNRWMMLIRCRAWVVFQGYSQEISTDCLKCFCCEDTSEGRWEFAVPTGQGQHIHLRISARMITGRNQIHLTFSRDHAGKNARVLASDQPVRLIIRPDIDDRDFHSVTKAYTGPEHRWHTATAPRPDGFSFTPHPDRVLLMTASAGEFTWEPEWRYMVWLPADAARGMDPNTDLFSPGYFSTFLKGADTLHLSAAVLSPGYDAVPLIRLMDSEIRGDFSHTLKKQPLPEAMTRAMGHFIVRRNSHQSVIAGYPWFLDWGRDTLIVSRGLIAAGFVEEARAILKQFAAFEHEGTLPNVIFGADTRNRDTSDAPLWLVAACRDLMERTGDRKFLDELCDARPLRDVLRSIVTGYVQGTFNGIRTDAATGLVFSPSHFTWMDTNFPAGTPRQGYPIEIQALWHNTLDFLSRVDNGKVADRWKTLADQVRASIGRLFYLETSGYLADCLYAAPGTPANDAEPDDALRPNQLFAITLGAVTDRHIMKNMIRQCAGLVVPGAIRTLADRPVKRPLEIIHNGRLLNDPHRPYQGVYTGDEDTRRKPAYHNGTAWTWVFPSFCEAWAMTYGEPAKQTALSLLSSSAEIISTGCAGHIPEILDGDYPHLQKGCDAQAWGVSEWLRVWTKLNNK